MFFLTFKTQLLSPSRFKVRKIKKVYIQKSMLQTTVYLVDIITLGAVSCLFMVTIKCWNKCIKSFRIVFLDKYLSKLFLNKQKEVLTEVQYNCSAHRSVHLFIIAIRSHRHIKRKQPQITFLQ